MTADATALSALAEQTVLALRALRPTALSLPASLASRLGLGKQEHTCLTGQGWALRRAQDARALACLHVTLIRGPKVEIVNAMAFPATDALPVFATEVVRFGEMIRVAFIDLQPLRPGDRPALSAALASARAQAEQTLPLDPALPAWLDGTCSGAEVMARSSDLAPVPAVCATWHAYLGVWLSLAGQAAAMEAGPADDSPALAAYKRHHREHSPGLTFLGKFFGTEWTQRYLGEFMYGSAYDDLSLTTWAEAAA